MQIRLLQFNNKDSDRTDKPYIKHLIIKWKHNGTSYWDFKEKYNSFSKGHHAITSSQADTHVSQHTHGAQTIFIKTGGREGHTQTHTHTHKIYIYIYIYMMQYISESWWWRVFKMLRHLNPLTELSALGQSILIWCGFDRASTICGNRMPN
jgi:hypothetical protein